MSKKWPVQDAKMRFLERMTRPDLKELLLASEARTDSLTPPRQQRRRRAPLVTE